METTCNGARRIRPASSTSCRLCDPRLSHVLLAQALVLLVVLNAWTVIFRHRASSDSFDPISRFQAREHSVSLKGGQFAACLPESRDCRRNTTPRAVLPPSRLGLSPWPHKPCPTDSRPTLNTRTPRARTSMLRSWPRRAGSSVHERVCPFGTIKQRRRLVEDEAACRADHKARLVAAVDAGRRRAVVAAADGLVADP